MSFAVSFNGSDILIPLLVGLVVFIVDMLLGNPAVACELLNVIR